MCLHKELVFFFPIHSGTLVLFGGDHTSLCLNIKMENKNVKVMTMTESKRSFFLHWGPSTEAGRRGREKRVSCEYVQGRRISSLFIGLRPV